MPKLEERAKIPLIPIGMTWNNFSNGTYIYPAFINTGEDAVLDNKTVAVGFTAAYSVIWLVALAGNSFVIHVARKQSQSRGSFSILIINMAAWDISYACFVAPHEIYYFYHGLLWLQGRFGSFLCKFASFGIVLSIFASVLSLTAMAVDRYIAIVHVMKTPLPRKKVLFVLITITVVASLFSATEWYKMDITTLEYGGISITQCYGAWSNDHKTNLMLLMVEVLANFIIFYAIPLVTMLTIYIVIIRSLWLRNVPGTIIDENERNRKRQCKKVILMLVTMVTVFAVGWLPVHVLHIGDTFNPEESYQLPYFAPEVMFLFAHMHCAINPCFYLIFNEAYRMELRALGQRFLKFYACFKANFRARRNMLLLRGNSGNPKKENTFEANELEN